MRSKKVTPTKTELYFYTGNKLSYITDGTKKLKYYFVRDLSGKLLQMIDYTGATPKAYIYILDIHGNVIGLSDNTGILVNYEYDAWGNIINIPQSAPVTGNGEPLVSANPFRYCGYQFDGETGFYYLKYRYYYPVIGRFLTKDPMMSYNRYMYCRNNPVNFVDPFGLAQLGLGDNDEILQMLPSGNIRNKQTIKNTKQIPNNIIDSAIINSNLTIDMILNNDKYAGPISKDPTFRSAIDLAIMHNGFSIPGKTRFGKIAKSIVGSVSIGKLLVDNYNDNIIEDSTYYIAGVGATNIGSMRVAQSSQQLMTSAGFWNMIDLASTRVTTLYNKAVNAYTQNINDSSNMYFSTDLYKIYGK